MTMTGRRGADESEGGVSLSPEELAEKDREYVAAPLSADVLFELLRRLNVNVEQDAVENACDRVRQEKPRATPVERVHQVLRDVRQKSLQASQFQWRRFDQRQLPAMIFHCDRWHLAERDGEGLILLTDSEKGHTSWQEADLQDAMVLWLHVQDVESVEWFAFEGNTAARLVWREMFREREWVVSVLLATLMINIFSIATSLFAMQVYDRVVPTLAYATLWTLVAGMGLVFALDWTLKLVRARILDSAASAVDKEVSQEIYEHIMHLRIDEFPRSLGTLAAQVGGLDAVRQFLSSGVVFALVDMPFALLFMACISVIGGPISWVYILLLPTALLLGAATQIRLRGLQREQMIRSNERQGLLVDSVRGVESIRANSATWRFSEDWEAMTASISGYSVRQKAIHSFAMTCNGLIANVAYVAAIVVGVGLIERGSLTVGGLIACTILGGRVIGPISQGVQHISRWQAVSQALTLVNELLSLETERRRNQGLLRPELVPEILHLDGVSFSYSGSTVDQLCIPELGLKSGDRVMVLGPIGCGKSTLLKVLAGLYKPQAGMVRLGDADLWETDPQTVATHLSYLPQAVHLFKGTLSSNLTLAGNVSDSRLMHVARALGIDAIAAESSMGMGREISEGGEGLSVGQRQLVGLGRLLVSKPKIWILDEPTAGVDPETEERIVRVLEAEVEPEDILVFSTHKPQTVSRLATRVVVMKGGGIEVDGPKEDVLPAVAPSANSGRRGRGVFGESPPRSSKTGAGISGDGSFF